MKTFYLLIIVLFFNGCCCSQQPKKTIYDINQQLIASYVGDSIDLKSFNYHDLKGRIVKATVGVEYIKGKDSLSRYLLDSFYSHPKYKNNEVNTTFFYYIYFDKELNVKEVRFVDFGLSEELKQTIKENNCYEILNEVLSNTGKKWKKEKSTNKNNFPIFIGSIKIM
jgi:hypothetical protein